MSDQAPVKAQRYVVVRENNGKPGEPSHFALSWFNRLTQRSVYLYQGDVFSLDEGDDVKIDLLIQSGAVASFEGELEEVNRGAKTSQV